MGLSRKKLPILFLAAFMLAFVVLARLPSRLCHCLDTKQTQDQHCPFSQLRKLANAVLLPDPVSLALEWRLEFIEPSHRVLDPIIAVVIPKNPRAPPVR